MRENEEQLGLLTRGNARELYKFKKKTKLIVSDQFSASDRDTLFDNLIGVITLEELAVIFRLAPQTIRNWIARGKIPHVRIGRRYFFQKRSLKRWLNQKEEPLWE